MATGFCLNNAMIKDEIILLPYLIESSKLIVDNSVLLDTFNILDKELSPIKEADEDERFFI